MRSETIDRFKKLFESQRAELLLSTRIIPEDFCITSDDRYDEIDQAAMDIEQSMRLRLKNREALNMKKIIEALRRIEEGTFGECTSCGEDIEVRRLEAKPTATLCVKCKEEQERLEFQIAPQYDSRLFGIGYSSHARRFA